jgi:hypothetical protein
VEWAPTVLGGTVCERLQRVVWAPAACHMGRPQPAAQDLCAPRSDPHSRCVWQLIGSYDTHITWQPITTLTHTHIIRTTLTGGLHCPVPAVCRMSACSGECDSTAQRTHTHTHGLHCPADSRHTHTHTHTHTDSTAQQTPGTHTRTHTHGLHCPADSRHTHTHTHMAAREVDCPVDSLASVAGHSTSAAHTL